MLVGSAIAFARSLRRISINVALTAVASAFFAAACLGGLPIADATQLTRFLAPVAAVTGVMLSYLLLAMLGVPKPDFLRTRVLPALVFVCAATVMAGWQLVPLHALALSIGECVLLALLALTLCMRSAIRGDRLAGVATLGVFFMLIAICGLGWIALDRKGAPWQVHAVSAISATFYLATTASVLWSRYAYLMELHQVTAFGPSYDPVTRLRSHAETGQLVGEVFNNFRNEPAPLGLMVITIANMYALEKLHGAVAINHALFVTAGRLRRSVPASAEMGRLGNDGFLIIMRKCEDSGRLISLARKLEALLKKPLSINTRRDVSRLETDNTIWTAGLGFGVLVVSNTAVRGASAISMARGMSRTAMSYESRIAWFDRSSGEIVELPVLAPA